MTNLITQCPVPKTGAVIIKSKRGNDRWIVLCRWDGHSAPFVTWAMGNEGSCFWGHYFKTLAEADKDYEERS